MSDLENKNGGELENKPHSPKPAKRKEKASGLNRAAAVTKKWFRELRSELKKVIWPSPKQLINNTLIVIAAVILVAIFVSLFDLGSQTVVNLLMNAFK